MLDVFLACFVVAAFLFALYDQDRDRRPRREPSRRWWNALLQRRWRLAAGAAAGGAVSTKWSGLFVLLGVLLLTVVAEFRACKREAEPGILLAKPVSPRSRSCCCPPSSTSLHMRAGSTEACWRRPGRWGRGTEP
jgi:hypothetical protein